MSNKYNKPQRKGGDLVLQAKDGTRFYIVLHTDSSDTVVARGMRGNAIMSFYANYEWFSSEEMSYCVLHHQSFPFGQPVPLSANITYSQFRKKSYKVSASQIKTFRQPAKIRGKRNMQVPGIKTL